MDVDGVTDMGKPVYDVVMQETSAGVVYRLRCTFDGRQTFDTNYSSERSAVQREANRLNAMEWPEKPKPKQSVAADMLLEAAKIIDGSRQKTHGDKERSFDAIADMWNAYLTMRGIVGSNKINASDVAQLMVLLKMARASQGEAARDHFLDAAGYAALAGELALKGNQDG